MREGKKAVLSSCWSTLQVPQSASDLPVPQDGTHTPTGTNNCNP